MLFSEIVSAAARQTSECGSCGEKEAVAPTTINAPIAIATIE